MNWLTSRFAAATLALAGLLAMTACDKDTNNLAVDLPSATAINSQFITVDLDVATVRQDSIETLKAEHFLVGRLTDNVAGTVEARSFLNLRISGDSLPSQFASTTPLTLDSVHLALNFDQVYGNSTTPGRFDLLELQNKLDETVAYNAASVVPVKANALATGLVGRFDRKVVVKTVTTTNTADTVRTLVADPAVHLVLKANRTAPNSAFVSGLLAVLSTTGFNQAQLDAYVKGLALVPSAGYSGAIASFGQPVRSRLIYYFHPGASKRLVVTSLLLGPTSGTGGGIASDPRYFTQFINTAAPGPLAVLTGNPQAAVPIAALGGASYVQEGTGLGTRIKFPANFVDLLNKPGLAINRAELYVPVKPYSNALFQNPPGIFAYEVNDRNRVLSRLINLVPTPRVVQANGSAPTGTGVDAIGLLTNSTTAAPYYSMVITTYLQAYLANNLSADRPTGFLLMPTEVSGTTAGISRNKVALNFNRAVIDGSNLKLRVYYSQLR